VCSCISVGRIYSFHYLGAQEIFAKILVAYKVGGPVVLSESQTDFVSKGLAVCSYINTDDAKANNIPIYVFSERTVIASIERACVDMDLSPSIWSHLDALNRSIQYFGANSSIKGNLIEPVLCHALLCYNNTGLKDFPQLKDLTLPAWAVNHTLKFTKMGFAEELGYANDLEYLRSMSNNSILKSSTLLLADFESKQTQDNSIHTTIASKWYTSPIPREMQEHNLFTSDPRNFFSRNGPKTDNRSAWEQHLQTSPIIGALRIHVELEPTPRKKAALVSNNDILVYFDRSSLHGFLEKLGKQQASNIMGIIEFVFNPPGDNNIPCGCGTKGNNKLCSTNRCRCTLAGRVCSSKCGCKSKHRICCQKSQPDYYTTRAFVKA